MRSLCPPNIRGKPSTQKQQQLNNKDIERADEQAGTDNDVIITGVSTYAEAAKVSNNNQPNAPGTTFIGKRVNFNKPKPNQQQSKFPKKQQTVQQGLLPPPRLPLLNNPPYQQNTGAPVNFSNQSTLPKNNANRRPPPHARPPLLNNPPYQQNNKAPENFSNQSISPQNNANNRPPPPPRPPLLNNPPYQQNGILPTPQPNTHQNRGYDSNVNSDPFLYTGLQTYRNP